MTTPEPELQESVRLLFEMTRDDNPRLYDDLLRFRKGTKRVNRLRLLANEGLMSLSAGGRSGVGGPVMAAREPARMSAGDRLSQALATNQAFGMTSADGEQG